VTHDRPSDLEPLTRIQILSVMGVTAVLLLGVAKAWQYWGQVGLLPVALGWWALWWGLVLAVAIVLSSGVVYQVWPAYRQSAASYLELVIKPLLWWDLIWLGLLPGLSEELLFRGVMLPALGLDFSAVIFSSVVFGVLHLSNPNQWPYVVWATVVGLALGYSALVSGNLFVPIVAHVLTNLVSSALWKWSRRANDI